MKPQSPLTYYWRHKRSALLVIGVIALVTVGIHVMVSVADASFEYGIYRLHYLTRLGHVSAEGGLAPEVVAQIRTHPDAAHVIPENGLEIGVPLVGIPTLFAAHGVSQADLPVVMGAFDLRLREGRMIEPRSAEILLSEELANALDLRIGDRIGRAIDDRYYAALVTELTVVGILESVPADPRPSVRAAFVSYEYLDSHEMYSPRPSSLLVLPRQGRKAALDAFLGTLDTDPADVRVKTYESETEFLAGTRIAGYGFYGFVDCLLAGTAALSVAAINQISNAQRLPEFGLLHALGNRKRRLIRRLVLEVAALAGGGWATGLALSLLLYALLNRGMYARQGWAINPMRLAPFLFTVPVPLVVIASSGVSVRRTLRLLDAVAVVERGVLSVEAGQHRRAVKRSSRQPLSFVTYYFRHRRRGAMSFLAIVLMVLGVSFPAFAMATYNAGNAPFTVGYLRHANVVAPVQVGSTVDPEAVAQIRSHPAVAHVVPAKPLSIMVNAAAAVFDEVVMPLYAVGEENTPVLVRAYGMRVAEGRLPLPRSNEIVLSRAMALNRGVGVGDSVGRPAHESDALPTEMVVVGILEPDGALSSAERASGVLVHVPQWVGFASYEYVEGHERYVALPTHFLVVPVPEREAELEAWLEEGVASSQVAVQTFGATYRFARDIERDLFLFYAVAEVIVAAAAAGALAVLQFLFFRQRREEFGALYAVGRSRAWLVWRALRESASVVGAAWLVGALLCAAGMLYVQANVYAPRGMSVNLYNPWPWLFTLPIPVAIVAASAGTIAWMLSRLDPVAVIERR